MGAALPVIAIGAQIAGTVLGAVGQIQEGQAVKQQMAYQAQVANNNKILAERAAQDALDRGRIEELRQRQATKQLIGRQRAVLASNGVQVDVGSALDITSDTAAIGELDALTIRSNAEREALGFRQQGANFSSEAQLAAMRGQAASSAGYSGAFGTLLSGTGAVAQKWYEFKKEGLWS